MTEEFNLLNFLSSVLTNKALVLQLFYLCKWNDHDVVDVRMHLKRIYWFSQLSTGNKYFFIFDDSICKHNYVFATISHSHTGGFADKPYTKLMHHFADTVLTSTDSIWARAFDLNSCLLKFCPFITLVLFSIIKQYNCLFSWLGLLFMGPNLLTCYGKTHKMQ